MAQIGNFGNYIIFKVSDEQVVTFNSFKQTVSARWTDTARIGRKPISEFNGPNLRKIKFEVYLDATLGVKPLEVIRKMTRVVGKGKVGTFVIGKNKIGFYKWRMTEISQSWDHIYSGGELVSARVDVTMEEYFEPNRKKVNKLTTSKSKSSTKSSTSDTKVIKYVVKKGDTLWALSKKYLGKGQLYTKIYNANKSVIESTAKKHGKSSSSNGHWIYPGTELEIEVAA